MLKDLFDGAEIMTFSPVYTLRFVKLMQTAEYLHQTFTPRDFTLLATELRNMAPCVDVLQILVKSVHYVYYCFDFQIFSDTRQEITTRARIVLRRSDISDAMLSAGVFDRMLTVCTQHPAQCEFLYRFLNILKNSSTATKNTFFGIQKNMSVLQALTLDATSRDRTTFSHECTTHVYAALMEFLYMQGEEWHHRPSAHDEVDVAVGMLKVMFKTTDMAYDHGAWKLCRIIIMFMQDSTLLTSKKDVNKNVVIEQVPN